MSENHDLNNEYYLSYTHAHKMVETLANRIKASGFVPDFTIAIGTGGFIPARMMKIFLKKKVLTVGLEYYNDENQTMENLIKVQWLEDDVEKLKGKKVLLIDEVNDSGMTMAYTLQELLKCGPEEIAVAVLHDKKKPKKAKMPKEITKYFVGEYTPDVWIHYPWESPDILYQNYMAAKFDEIHRKEILDL